METTKRIMAIVLVLAVWAAPAIVHLVYCLIERLEVREMAMIVVPVGAIALWVIVRVMREYPAEVTGDATDVPPESD